MNRGRGFWRVMEATAAIVFWLQAARVVFSMLFGVIYDAIFDEEISMAVVGMWMVSLLIALVIPVITRPAGTSGKRKDLLPFLAMLVAAVARIFMTIDDPMTRLGSGIVILGAVGAYIGLLLHRDEAVLPVALIAGLLVDQIARAANTSWDITLVPEYLPFVIVITLGVIAISWTVHARGPFSSDGQPVRILGIGGGVALGALLFLEMSLLAQPNAIARWTEVSYGVAAPALLIVTALPLFALSEGQAERFGGEVSERLASWGVVPRTVLLAGGATLGLAAGRYLGGWIGLAGLLICQLLLTFSLPMLFATQTTTSRNRGGSAIAAGGIVFLVLNLLYAFTFTYADTVPALRDWGTRVLLLGVLFSVLPAAFRAPKVKRRDSLSWNNHLIVGFSLLLVLVLVWSDIEQPPSQVPESGSTLRVATYNIHYGYDSDWHYTLAAQADAIGHSRADVVFLQEVDAGRVTSYGVDNALWLANRLGMRAVFAPTLEGLSGIALLSRLPVLESDWEWLPSDLEQTAIVYAQVDVGANSLVTYGVWFGLEPAERLNQVNAALQYIGDSEAALLGGDMNAEPDSPVYQRIQDAGFSDPFVETGNLPAYTSPSLNPDERIDYVWARGLRTIDAEVAESQASDHRLVLVQVGAP